MAPAVPPTTPFRSASGSTIIGDLPPSSSDTRLMVSVALLLISLPTSVEPVNAILSTPGCATNAAPVVSPSPVRMFTTPGGKPRLFRRLQHAGAARGQRRTQFPCGHGQWKIPRHDLRDDAHRLARHIGMKLGARDAERRLHRGTFDLSGPAGHVAEIVSRARHVDDARHEARLAIVEALDLGELRGIPIDEIGQLPQQFLAP